MAETKNYVLSWGNPTIECTKLTATGETTGSAIVFPAIKQGTAQLTTTEGSKIEAKDLGGNVVDQRVEVNTYEFVCQVYVQNSTPDPIPHENGVVADNYEFKLTPESASCRGFMFKKAKVSVVNLWTADDGELLEYHFKALKDNQGKQLTYHVGGVEQ